MTSSSKKFPTDKMCQEDDAVELQRDTKNAAGKVCNLQSSNALFNFLRLCDPSR